MRATHTKATDYDKMLRFVRPRTGHAAPDIIQAYADKHKIVRHRAGKLDADLNGKNHGGERNWIKLNS